MDTPICDFVKKYTDKNAVRMHMPGHKGKVMLGVESLDITEIDGADVLYDGTGIIAKSQQNATQLFGTAKTLYSTEGSSLSIRAMLYLVSMYAKSVKKKAVIAAGRNAHKTFISASAMLDFDINWIYSDSLICCDIKPDILKEIFEQSAPVALYVTSPDYLGNTLDISTLANICHDHGCLLIVDNAHGAYLNFLSSSKHPIALGADMCCDSAHKTLPVLTGGGYLHISKNAPDLLFDNAEIAMSLFSSTSPSYLILQSLDSVNAYLANGYTKKLCEFEKIICSLKTKLQHKGFTLIGNELLKITIETKSYGYTGNEIANILANNNIICEFYDNDYIVLMLTPETENSELKHLIDVLLSIDKKDIVFDKAPIPPKPERVLSVREAILSPSIEININKCKGKVLASACVSCPPAIPIAVCGERIDEQTIKCFEYYGITKCRIIG